MATRNFVMIDGVWCRRDTLSCVTAEDTVQFAFGGPPKKCECGAFKASKVQQGAPGHSSWCPWAVAP